MSTASPITLAVASGVLSLVLDAFATLGVKDATLEKITTDPNLVPLTRGLIIYGRSVMLNTDDPLPELAEALNATVDQLLSELPKEVSPALPEPVYGTEEGEDA